jgi:hypothetical protein
MCPFANFEIARIALRRHRVDPRHRRRVVKPMTWPNYMIEKALPSGATRYYWNPPSRDLKAGFTLHREALRKGAPAKPFLLRTARDRVRDAARKAGLPDDLTLAACRHGGLTEFGDAQLTEQGVMALSGHKPLGRLGST